MLSRGIVGIPVIVRAERSPLHGFDVGSPGAMSMATLSPAVEAQPPNRRTLSESGENLPEFLGGVLVILRDGELQGGFQMWTGLLGLAGGE